MKRIQIDWPKWSDIINERFLQLVDNRDRYLILIGGRGSSKSDFVAKKLIYRCLTERYFRCILIRNTYNSIKDSQFQTLRDIIHDLGLTNLFEFKLSPLEIVCKNGNIFLCRGCDDVQKLKSIKDPSACWIEEDIISESDWVTITTGIRTSKASYLQEIYSLNPECEEDFQLNWFYKRFFQDRDALSFSDKVSVEIKKDVFEELKFTVHHSTYKDNRWITVQFVAQLEDMKRTDAYYYQVYCLGRWGQKLRGGAAYKMFSMAKNVRPVEYDKNLPLWLSFDFNTLPGVSLGIYQIANKVMKMIDEIQLVPPRNNTKSVCLEVIRKYQGHTSGMFITGDPAGRHKDTRSELGWDDYGIIMGTLGQFRPTLRVQNSAPGITPRINFINNIFEGGCQGLELIIGDKCSKMIADLLYGMEASDGTKLKERVRDPRTGATYERYHHYSDLMEYFVCTVYYSEFKQYLTGGRKGFQPMYGKSYKSSFGNSLNLTIKPQSKNQYS